MLSLFNALSSLFARSPAGGTTPADEDYLNAAADLCDLERRMRAIDTGRRQALSGVTFGQYLY